MKKLKLRKESIRILTTDLHRINGGQPKETDTTYGRCGPMTPYTPDCGKTINPGPPTSDPCLPTF